MSTPRSLLIVEDDRDSCEMLLMVIQKLFPDMVAHCAGNGIAGWQLFQEYLPEIVITDLNMPEMDGLQMAQLIRSHKPDTKLVAISADIERATQEESVAEGRIFDCYIVKPFKFSALTAAIEGIVPFANES